ncbi:MAG TPA: class I SAM-dependent methyltransferase [Alphaproteobacteria bacterium]|nr:class I SAM-dependent methyltransferase [Alphaproteobacteria bacterium]
MHRDSHSGAKQPHIFSHEKAGWLDEPQREGWLPTPTLIDLLEVAPGMRILDFGAGTGRYAVALAERNPQTRVVAFDVQPEFLAIIAQRIAERGLANIRAADRIEGRFDRIFALNVLHEIGDDDLRVMRASLRPAGFVLVVDWDASIDRPTGPPREHAHTLEEGRERLRAAGFCGIRSIPEPMLPYHFVLRASLL